MTIRVQHEARESQCTGLQDLTPYVRESESHQLFLHRVVNDLD